jgi:hypothetical protein
VHPSLTATSRAGAALAFLVCSVLGAGTAFAADKPLLLPQGTGQRADFQFTSDTESGHGATTQSWLLSLVRSDRGIDLALSAPNAQPARYGGWVQKDGTLGIRADENAPALFVVRRYNEVAGLLAGAPDSPKTGDSWKAQIDVPLPLGGSTRVPVTVTVLAAGDTLSLVADGEAKVAISGTREQGGPTPATGVFSGSTATTAGGIPGGGQGAPGGGPGALGGPAAGSGPAGQYQTGSSAPAGTDNTGHALTAPQSLVAVHAAAHFENGKFAAADGTIRVVTEAPDSPATLSTWSLTGR